MAERAGSAPAPCLRPLAQAPGCPRPLPPALCAVLAAQTPVKVGRGVADDANRLEAEGCCDVGWVDELPGRESLKDLAARVPALPRVTRRQAGGFMTNWEARALSPDTLHYAAFDAIAAAATEHGAEIACNATVSRVLYEQAGGGEPGGRVAPQSGRLRPRQPQDQGAGPAALLLVLRRLPTRCSRGLWF